MGGKMKHLMLLLLASSFLIGCEEVYKGQLSLNQSIEFMEPLNRRDQRELDRCEKRNSRSHKCRRLRKKAEESRKIVNSGDYGAKLIPGKSKVKLKILDNRGKTETEFSVKVPKSVKLPRTNGSFELLSSETAFVFDIKGNLNTEITYSESRRDVESCTWTERVRVCKRVRERIPGCTEVTENTNADRPRNRRPPKRNCTRVVRKCDYEYQTYHGYQRVEFHYKYTDKFITFSMLQPESRELAGEFNGKYHDSDKVYTYREVCH